MEDICDTASDKIAIFDTLFTTNQIQMYKILFSCLPASFQKVFAIYIKYAELQYTMNFFNQCTPKSDPPDFAVLCKELLPYLTPSEQTKLEQVQNMMNSMKNMQEMMGMVELMKDMFPEGFGDGSFDPSQLGDIMEMMQGMQS